MNYHLAIISSRRAHTVSAINGYLPGGTWYVGDGEGLEYTTAGAERVIEAGGLVAARNAALEDAFSQGLPCVQLDDDLTKVERFDGLTAEPASLSDAVDEALGLLDDNCRLVGVAPTANSFYASTKVKRRHFIVGDFFVAAPSSIRFDPELRLKEDYDYTAAHLAKFGEVARMDWWLLTFKHRTNPGGAVAYRTADLEQEAIAILRRKWGKWIRPNPRRPNEVLLRATT